MRNFEKDFFLFRILSEAAKSPSSALIVRHIYNALKENKISESKELLLRALSLYKDHPLLYFLSAILFLKIDEENTALSFLKITSELLNNSALLDAYISMINDLKKDRLGDKYVLGDLNEECTRILSPVIIEEELKESILRDFEYLRYSGPEVIKSIDKGDYNETGGFASVTMAEFYISLGDFGKAISIYENLKKKDPSNIPAFESKIRELKEKSVL